MQSFSSSFVCAARCCGIASLAEAVAVLLMQFTLLVRAGICNLFKVPVITRLLFAKDTVRSLTSTNECWQTGFPFNVHPRDGTHIDETPWL